MHAITCLLLPLAALSIALAGCAKSQPDASSPTTEPGAATVTDAQDSAVPEPAPDLGTNEPATAAGQFARKSQASPFANADMALRETYDRALIAHQIGDYPRALAELQDLAANTALNPQQRRAVQDLLAEIKKADPAAASAASLASNLPKAEPTGEFPLATPSGAESAKNPSDVAFSTADLAVRESFRRANAAFDIGDYGSALTELKDLATNVQLNAQQKYAVQSLLDKTPQTLPTATAGQPLSKP